MNGPPRGPGASPGALLALEDGTLFPGEALGALGTVTGEVCFNTSMTGYQEVLTDPSYHGQIIALTAPHVGNTGVNGEDDQARRPWAAGLVVREASATYSSWRATSSLSAYLERHRVVAATEINTRALTRHVRSRGALKGALSSTVTDVSELVDIARSSPSYGGRDLVAEVSTPAPYVRAPVAGPAPARRVAALDLGIKANMLDLLSRSGCEVTVLPASTPASEILARGYDGVLLSNGPGDPAPLSGVIATVSELIGRVPVFGICLGHQILSLALGGTTYKLPFGHRGGNHPVRRAEDGRVEITCQNHGFAVTPGSLDKTGARVTHVNLNDQTIEGIALDGVCFSVQYHPESGPGPRDARYLFERFTELMARFQAVPAPLPEPARSA
ncbi:MAG: glutamine-hydrolyzing carbamoyl-phosphate synthase small subunit [Actinomycetota bacterium]|nr:glutamine-hydrolyzing carbamoyl-phosphate synthase small subunit [Actinomycetota bacterium]